MEDVYRFIELLQLYSVIGWNSCAKNQHLVRLILGHSPTSPLYMDPDHVDPFALLNDLRPESNKALVLTCFFMLLVCTVPTSIVGHITTVASLYLPRHRHFGHGSMT